MPRRARSGFLIPRDKPIPTGRRDIDQAPLGRNTHPRYVCNKKQAMSFRKISLCMRLRGYSMYVTSWGFLTNHGRVLLCIARDPGVRLRDIADRLGITERSAHGIVTDLAEAGYVVTHKDGRRNR